MPNGPIPKDPSNHYLAEEIRDNRREILELHRLLANKVGRRELWGSIGVIGVVVGMAARFLS